MESNRTEPVKPVEAKPMTAAQIGLWTIGILAGFSALFVLFSLISPG